MRPNEKERGLTIPGRQPTHGGAILFFINSWTNVYTRDSQRGVQGPYYASHRTWIYFRRESAGLWIGAPFFLHPSFIPYFQDHILCGKKFFSHSIVVYDPGEKGNREGMRYRALAQVHLRQFNLRNKGNFQAEGYYPSTCASTYGHTTYIPERTRRRCLDGSGSICMNLFSFLSSCFFSPALLRWNEISKCISPWRFFIFPSCVINVCLLTERELKTKICFNQAYNCNVHMV